MSSKVKYLVIHCTATPENREVSGDTIRHWHTDPKPKGRGWKQVGYTDVFHLNGGVERLAKNNDDTVVDTWEITNGAVGINSISRHIVYVGGLTEDAKKAKDTRTCEQKQALAKYIREFIKVNPDVMIAGHNQFAAKACPSFDVPSWLRSINIPDKNIYTK